MRRLGDLGDEMVEMVGLTFEKPAVLCAPPLAAQATLALTLTLTLKLTLALALALAPTLTLTAAGRAG